MDDKQAWEELKKSFRSLRDDNIRLCEHFNKRLVEALSMKLRVKAQGNAQLIADVEDYIKDLIRVRNVAKTELIKIDMSIDIIDHYEI